MSCRQDRRHGQPPQSIPHVRRWWRDRFNPNGRDTQPPRQQMQAALVEPSSDQFPGRHAVDRRRGGTRSRDSGLVREPGGAGAGRGIAAKNRIGDRDAFSRSSDRCHAPSLGGRAGGRDRKPTRNFGRNGEIPSIEGPRPTLPETKRLCPSTELAVGFSVDGSPLPRRRGAL